MAVPGPSCGRQNLSCGMWDIIYFLDQGLNPGTLPWQCGILAAGPPEKSSSMGFNRSSRSVVKEM